MKPFNFKYKITAISLALLFISLSLPRINEHTYTTGLDNFYKESFLFSCWGGYTYHSSYYCGKFFHVFN